MTVHQELVNFEQWFQSLRIPPVIFNDVDNNTMDDKQRLKAMLYTSYASDVMSTVPSCECGNIVGEFNVGIYCNNCYSTVTSSQSTRLEPILWLRKPKDVQKFINPVIWSMLSIIFKKASFELIRWLTDTSYRYKGTEPKVIVDVQRLNIQRGYNHFVTNFYTIIDLLFNMKDHYKKPIKDDFYRLLREYSDCIFTDYLPIPNKALVVLEETTVGRYTDFTTFKAIDSCLLLAGIDRAVGYNATIRNRENRTAKMLHELSTFYQLYNSKSLAQKTGLFRKHAFATRAHFSFRAVITSITEPHSKDELYLPWGVAIGVLKYHLINKLIKRGFRACETVGFLNAHAKRYHPLIDELFRELILDSPEGGIPVTFCRNPSLARSSIQKFIVTKIKTDPTIPTISMSILDVVGYNADFDGDAMGGQLALDLMMSAEFDSLKPDKSVFDVNRVRTVSSNPSIPKPVIATLGDYVRQTPTSIDQTAMDEFLIVV